MYWAQLFGMIGIHDFTAWKNERRLNKFLDKVADNREYVTEEIAYAMYHSSTGKNLSLRQLSLTRLPVIDTKRIIKITQVSCKPLWFIPRENTYGY